MSWFSSFVGRFSGDPHWPVLGDPRGSTSDAISSVVKAFPAFSKRWRKHIEESGGKPAGSYNDMAEFVYFVVEDLYEKGELEEVRSVFQFMEQRFVRGDQETRDLIGWGFFETLQSVTSWRAYGYKVFEQFLGSTSEQIWREIQRMWVGKSSLADVIRAERERD